MLAGPGRRNARARARRVPLAVDHHHDQADQPRHHGAEADRGEESESLPVPVDVDLVRLTADLFELFGRFVHSMACADAYNHNACPATFGRSFERWSARRRSRRPPAPRRGPWPPDPARVRSIVEGLEELYPDVDCELDRETPFQLVCATILSAQCTDERVNMVTPELFRRYPTPRRWRRRRCRRWRRSSAAPASSARRRRASRARRRACLRGSAARCRERSRS